MIVQLCGLSGSGKTTLSYNIKKMLSSYNILVEVIDGDEYRKELCSDLGYSKNDRNVNIRRLAFVASKLSQFNIVTIVCAINPYENIRKEIKAKYEGVYTIFISCDLKILIQRDTKGLYKKALLPDGNPNKINNLTGINDPFEIPMAADLVIHSDIETIIESTDKLVNFILTNYNRS